MLSKVALFLGALSSAALVRSAPVFPVASTVNDTNIMNFALTLEHVEHAFYEQALAQYDDAAFAAAGFEPWVRGRFLQIQNHEKTHVEFLTSQLEAAGVTPTQPCNYSYPYTDVQSFVTLSWTIESVGAAAYLGASRFIADKDTLIASNSISQVEARQAGWVAASAKKLQPWDGDFETPLYFSNAFSLAVGFIESCPDTNPAIPITVFPAVSVSNAQPGYSETIEVSYNLTTAYDGPAYFAWYSGLNTTYTPIVDGTTTVPWGLLGTVFGGVVSNTTAVTDDSTILTGLTAINFPFAANCTDPRS